LGSDLGHPTPVTALLDACVLYPLAMADSLMSLASTGLFAAKWTTQIEHEWMRSLEARRPDLQGKLGFRRDQMRLAVPDWEVTEEAWRAFVQPQLTLPDPDDIHVLAAALAGRVDCIVTANLKDFPAKVLSQHGLEAIHPDAFITELWDAEPIAAIAAFKSMRARWKKPKAAPKDFAQAMERGGLWCLAGRLRDAAELI
jgi:predicted nucleic acid-binding protein